MHYLIFEASKIHREENLQALSPEKSWEVAFLSVIVVALFVCADEGSEVESEMDEELDDSSEPQAKREKTELTPAFPVGCLQPVLESSVQPSLLNPIHSEHIVTSTQTIRQCSATGNTYTAV